LGEHLTQKTFLGEQSRQMFPRICLAVNVFRYRSLEHKTLI